MFLGAITVSYNLPGVQSGLKLDGKTIAEIFLGKIKTWNDAADQGAEPGRVAAEHGDHRDPPLRLLRHDRRLHRLPVRGGPRMEEQGRRRQGRAVADGHRRQGQRGRGRRGPADDRRGRIRRAGLCAAAQIHLRQRARTRRASTSNRRSPPPARPPKGSKCRPTSGIKIKNPSSPAAYPITSQTFVVVYKDMCKAGVPGGESAAKGVVKFLDYGLGSGQSILSQADYAALPAAILDQVKGSRGRTAVQRSTITG